ncbi:hypothetical protein D3C85_270250 [compost metagenome]
MRDHDRFQAVDFLEFVRFGIGRTRHAGQLGVHAEVVLEGDRGQGLVLVLDLDAFFRFDGLVQAIGPAATRHQTAREFIDDHHFIVLHHIVLILEVQRMRAQGRIQVVHEGDVGRIVQRRAFRQQAHFHQDAFGLFVAGFRQQHLVRFFILGVVARHFNLALAIRRFFADLQGQARRHFIDLVIQVRMVLGLARNDQRRTRFIDQDRVDFIDDAEVQAALHAFARFVDHIVAQEVETEFIVGAIGDVGVVRLLLGAVLHLRHVHASRQAQPCIQAAHGFGIALRQVIIDGDDMHALARQGIQVGGQGCHQGLALARAHLRDLTEMQDHAADHLHVEMAHAQDALAGLAADGKCFRQQGIERFASGDAFLEGRRFRLQLGIRQLFDGRLERIDLAYRFLVLLEQPLVAATENLGQ